MPYECQHDPRHPEHVHDPESGDPDDRDHYDCDPECSAESPYYFQPLDGSNLADLLHDITEHVRADAERTTVSHELIGIVSEEDGGIIAYAIGEEHAARITSALAERRTVAP